LGCSARENDDDDDDNNNNNSIEEGFISRPRYRVWGYGHNCVGVLSNILSPHE
jgi:hypothetical protein